MYGLRWYTPLYPSLFVLLESVTNLGVFPVPLQGVLTSLATFTFTENFKRTSPFAHLLPPWSGLLTHPINTISQAISVYRMHVQHNSMLTREKRHRRIDDAEKRRQYRIAHGLEEPDLAGAPVVDEDDQSPVAPEAAKGPPPAVRATEYRDVVGQTRPAKKWLGIW